MHYNMDCGKSKFADNNIFTKSQINQSSASFQEARNQRIQDFSKQSRAETFMKKRLTKGKQCFNQQEANEACQLFSAQRAEKIVSTFVQNSYDLKAFVELKELLHDILLMPDILLPQIKEICYKLSIFLDHQDVALVLDAVCCFVQISFMDRKISQFSVEYASKILNIVINKMSYTYIANKCLMFLSNVCLDFFKDAQFPQVQIVKNHIIDFIYLASREQEALKLLHIILKTETFNQLCLEAQQELVEQLDASELTYYKYELILLVSQQSTLSILQMQRYWLFISGQIREEKGIILGLTFLEQLTLQANEQQFYQHLSNLFYQDTKESETIYEVLSSLLQGKGREVQQKVIQIFQNLFLIPMLPFNKANLNKILSICNQILESKIPNLEESVIIMYWNLIISAQFQDQNTFEVLKKSVEGMLSNYQIIIYENQNQKVVYSKYQTPDFIDILLGFIYKIQQALSTKWSPVVIENIQKLSGLRENIGFLCQHILSLMV